MTSQRLKRSLPRTAFVPAFGLLAVLVCWMVYIMEYGRLGGWLDFIVAYLTATMYCWFTQIIRDFAMRVAGYNHRLIIYSPSRWRAQTRLLLKEQDAEIRSDGGYPSYWTHMLLPNLFWWLWLPLEVYLEYVRGRRYGSSSPVLD